MLAYANCCDFISTYVISGQESLTAVVEVLIDIVFAASASAKADVRVLAFKFFPWCGCSIIVFHLY